MPFRFQGVQSQTRDILIGLGSPIEVRVDDHGIHHIFADSESDLFRAQGFITARDRLFQMDLLRRMAGGRLAEIFGDIPDIGFDPVLQLRGNGLASIDYFMRVFGLKQAAEEGLGWCSARTNRALLAYAEGVNEWIWKAKKFNKLPFGYQFLQQEPAEWRPRDCLLCLRLLAFQTSFSWRLILAFGALCNRLAAKPAALLSMLPPHLSLSLDPDSLPSGFLPLTGVQKGTDCLDPNTNNDEFKLFGGTGQGSCAWAVGGQHTASGFPILCHDPHLLLRLPAPLYLVHLHAGEYNVIGFSIPGTCGVYAGHNEHIAWGASLSRIDDADIYIEDLESSNERFRHRNRLLPLIRREEVIRVRGEPPKIRWVRATTHGPLISDALRGPLPDRFAYSLRWTGHEAVQEAEAMLTLNRARHWTQFRNALRFARVPAMNYVYADCQGHVGWSFAGRSPIRPVRPRLLRPLPAVTGEHDWLGEVPFEDWPHQLDPPEGFAITCGQNPQTQQHNHHMDGFWENEFRYKRIQALLTRKIEAGITPHDMERIQRDQYCLWSLDFIQRHLQPFQHQLSLDPEIRKIYESMLRWNGRTGPESIATSIFSTFLNKIMDLGYRSHLGHQLYRSWIHIAQELEPPCEALFRQPDAWLSEPLDEMVASALRDTYKTLKETLGADTNDWNWGSLHKLTLRPFFFSGSGLQDLFLRGPLTTGGNAFCINAGTHTWGRQHFEHRVGAAARQVIQLHDWQQSSWILCGGQKENPKAKQYDDQLFLWQQGNYLPMNFSKNSLQDHNLEFLLPHPDTQLPESLTTAISTKDSPTG